MTETGTFKIRAKVFVVISSYQQAIARSPDDHWQLAITRHTEGVSLDEVREGQMYLLTVTRCFSRVLHAELIDPEIDSVLSRS